MFTISLAFIFASGLFRCNSAGNTGIIVPNIAFSALKTAS